MEEKTTPASANGGADREGSEPAGFSEARRDFLKGALTVGGIAASWGTAGLSSVSNAQAQPAMVPGTKNHYYIPATDKTVHWGYFSKLLPPLVEVNSGDFVTIEALTHHANDDAERMVKGDPGAESVFSVYPAFAASTGAVSESSVPSFPVGADVAVDVVVEVVPAGVVGCVLLLLPPHATSPRLNAAATAYVMILSLLIVVLLPSVRAGRRPDRPAGVPRAQG